MKLIFLTDLHGRGDNPRSRRDSYQEAMWRKATEVFALAKQHQCQAILFGGDLTHTPDVASSVVRDLISLLREAPCPIIGISGNSHDVWGGQPDTIRRTALGIVEAAGCIKLIQPGEPVILDVQDVFVQITGQPFHPDLDRRDPRLDYCVYEDDDSTAPPGHAHRRPPGLDWAVHLVHGMLRTSDLPGAPVTLVQDVAPHSVADITLTGHDHGGFAPVNYQDRIWCNPGALMRGSAAREEIGRPVQVALLEFTEATCGLQLIQLTTAAPGDEVLDRTHIEEEQARVQALEAFLGGVRAGGDYQVLDLTGVVNRIAANKGIPEAVRVEALQRLARARETLAKTGDTEVA